jgi:hypothetical protein
VHDDLGDSKTQRLTLLRKEHSLGLEAPPAIDFAPDSRFAPVESFLPVVNIQRGVHPVWIGWYGFSWESECGFLLMGKRL